MRRFGLPVLPLILGVILGPRLEKQLRQTLQLSAGDVSGLWSEPIAIVVYIIVALVLLWPLLFKAWRRARPAHSPRRLRAAQSPAARSSRSTADRPTAAVRRARRHARQPWTGEIVSIIVGYVPTPEGAAALNRAISEAQKNQSRLVIVNSSRGDALVDKRYVQAEDLTADHAAAGEEGVEHLVLQPVRGNDAANEVLDAAEEYQAELIVIGLRKPHSRREADHGQHGAADPARSVLPRAGGQGRRLITHQSRTSQTGGPGPVGIPGPRLHHPHVEKDHP